MIEDMDTSAERRDHAPDGRSGESLHYDLAKFLTTLSLITVGGILSLTEAAPEGVYRPTWLLLVLASVALVRPRDGRVRVDVVERPRVIRTDS